MKKILIALAAVAGLLLTADTASAGGTANPVNVPTHNGRPVARFFLKQPLPAFQAAPWYLYWPYNSHFMMAAPPLDYDYGPAAHTHGPQVNPYFPGHYGPKR